MSSIKTMSLNSILLSGVMLTSYALVNNQHENHKEEIGSQQKAIAIKRSYVEVMAETVFSDVIDLTKPMQSECVSDPRIEDGSYIWICFLKPDFIEVNGRFQTVPPDTGEWMLNFDFKESTYQLKRTWVHNAQNHGGVIKNEYIEGMAQSVLSDIGGSTNHTNTSCEIDVNIEEGSYVWACKMPIKSINANSKNKSLVSGSNDMMLTINFKKNTCELNEL